MKSRVRSALAGTGVASCGVTLKSFTGGSSSVIGMASVACIIGGFCGAQATRARSEPTKREPLRNAWALGRFNRLLYFSERKSRQFARKMRAGLIFEISIGR